jgi:hypothetical protein
MTDVALRDGQSTTYAGSITGLVPVAGDILTFTAPTVQGRLMKLIRLSVTAVATAASVADLILVKRSTVDTAGTGAGVSTTPYDPQSAAASTIVTSYTAAPTPGTLIGSAIRAAKLTYGLAASGPTGPVTWQFADRASMAPRLFGPPQGSVTVAQQICVNLSAAPAGILVDIDFEFTEDLY